LDSGLSGLRMWFVARNKWGGAKSKVVPDYKLEHTNKEMDGRLTSLLLLARFFSSTLSDRVYLPNVLVHSFACIIAPSTWCFRFESPPWSLASHASMIFLQNKALAAPPCLSLHVFWDVKRGIPWCIMVHVWLG
jgi:hypothetical protein